MVTFANFVVLNVMCRVLQIRLWGCGVVVVSTSGERSLNCIHDLGDQGCVIMVRRYLLAAPCDRDDSTGARSKRPPPLPAMQVHVSLPVLDIRVADTEYQTTLHVLASNYAEQLALDPAIVTLQVAVAERQEVIQEALAHARGMAVIAKPARPTAEHVSAGAADVSTGSPKALAGRQSEGRARGWSHMTAGSRATLPGSHDFKRSVADVLRAMHERFSMGVTVLVGRASLQLSNHLPGSKTPQVRSTYRYYEKTTECHLCLSLL